MFPTALNNVFMIEISLERSTKKLVEVSCNRGLLFILVGVFTNYNLQQRHLIG